VPCARLAPGGKKGGDGGGVIFCGSELLRPATVALLCSLAPSLGRCCSAVFTSSVLWQCDHGVGAEDLRFRGSVPFRKTFEDLFRVMVL
jgi:hypothetical protein